MKKIYTVLTAALVSFGITDYVMPKTKTTIVCIKGNVPQELHAQLRCYHHYDVTTGDGYHCYIKFEIGRGIEIVEDRENNVLPEEYGTTHLATYEIHTKAGNFPAALKFADKVRGKGTGKIDIQTLMKPNNVRELVQGLGLKFTAKQMKEIMLENNLTNFEKLKSMLGNKIENCGVNK